LAASASTSATRRSLSSTPPFTTFVPFTATASASTATAATGNLSTATTPRRTTALHNSIATSRPTIRGTAIARTAAAVVRILVVPEYLARCPIRRSLTERTGRLLQTGLDPLLNRIGQRPTPPILAIPLRRLPRASVARGPGVRAGSILDS
jgi:hypothetical protein